VCTKSSTFTDSFDGDTHLVRHYPCFTIGETEARRGKFTFFKVTVVTSVVAHAYHMQRQKALKFKASLAKLDPVSKTKGLGCSLIDRALV
jgi:hypothetical protein